MRRASSARFQCKFGSALSEDEHVDSSTSIEISMKTFTTANKLFQLSPASKPMLVPKNRARPDKGVILNGRAVPQKDGTRDGHEIADSDSALKEPVVANTLPSQGITEPTTGAKTHTRVSRPVEI